LPLLQNNGANKIGTGVPFRSRPLLQLFSLLFMSAYSHVAPNEETFNEHPPSGYAGFEKRSAFAGRLRSFLSFFFSFLSFFPFLFPFFFAKNARTTEGRR